MKYVIIGAGGTGGIVGAYMTRAGKDVTVIARGEHLRRIKECGLCIEQLWDGKVWNAPVKASSMEEYTGRPDVILVCVKGYSLEETVPFIRRVAGEETVVIPILNIYGTGGKLQEKLPQIPVMDGCIYVSANIKEPGTLVQHGDICRLLFGPRKQEECRPMLKEIARDLADSGIQGGLSENIQRDAMQKFSYVSPVGAAGLFYQAKAGDFQKEGEPREMFGAMIGEIAAIARAMGITFSQDLTEVNMKILAGLSPEATTSMQRDIMDGKPSEIDGLVFEVVRLGHKYQVPVPQYEKVAERFGFASAGK